MKARIIEKTIACGRNSYRITSDGKWKILLWGTWPNSNGIPSYRWVFISETKIPESVIQAV